MHPNPQTPKFTHLDKIEVMIEIPEGQGEVKYEIEYSNHQAIVRVDRFCGTTLKFPCNYGFIPHTQGGDGDALDALVITPVPLVIGALIQVRPLGVVIMVDESGMDEKIIAVPDRPLTSLYDHINDFQDLPPLLLARITHFFAHYKDLEQGKWVQLREVQGVDSAYTIIERSYKRFQAEQVTQGKK